jgi:hypothetical protein
LHFLLFSFFVCLGGRIAQRGVERRAALRI